MRGALHIRFFTEGEHQLIAPGRRIYIAAGDYPMLTTAYDRWFWTAMDQRFRQEGFPAPLLERLSGTNPARTLGPKLDLPCYTPLSHGAVLSVGARTLQVIHTPGHTPGQLCLWCPEEGILFSSDHILFDITPNINLWPNLPNSLSHYLDSLRAIDRLPARLVLPGHRGGGDLHNRVRMLLQHHTNRVSETLAIVRAHPGRTAYEIAADMTWDIQAEDWAHFPANQKWFATGEAIAHLEFLTAQGAVAREMDQNQVAQYRCPGGNTFAGTGAFARRRIFPISRVPVSTAAKKASNLHHRGLLAFFYNPLFFADSLCLGTQT